jgi:deoxyribodipyrimidine photo-lyase
MPDTHDSTGPALLWLRRDLRLGDHPGWSAALASGGPVIPVFILDPIFESYRAAPKWRLGESLRELDRTLERHGSRMVLRRGEAAEVLDALIAETGAGRVVWSRLYDSRSAARDRAIEERLVARGVAVESVNASLLFEPQTVLAQSDSGYKVYSPFWRAVRGLDVPEPLAAPGNLQPPARWPRSDRLEDWELGAAMNRGAAVVARHARVGEAAAQDRLHAFLEAGIGRYKADRNVPSLGATSGLSENLTYGEISPGAVWHAGRRAMQRQGHSAEAEHFVKELVWREFAYHLLWHTPRIETAHWREEWNRFPWRGDNADAERWRRGMTGYEMVDAAMREMYVTGTMHNRTRMLAASFLTKHLLTDWRVGDAWFRECLIDWDVASNALGWQWTAGSGPDAAPYFRVYNPETQARKFDPDGRYRDRFIAEGREAPHGDALSFFDAVPRSWGLSPAQHYPSPVIGLAEGRARALEAYAKRDAA